MKTLKKSILILACSLLMIGMAGCKKDAGTGSMTVRMTDAPAAYSAVNVDVRAVAIHYSDAEVGNDGWVDLPTNVGIYNLLELQNDVTVVLADEPSLPLGKVDQLRLTLGENNTLEDSAGVIFSLKVPSGMETGIKINADTDIEFKSHIEVVLDFEAEKSVVVEGNGSFSLKPVIQVESISET